MSLYDYRVSQQLSKDDPPFYALIMAAMRKADTANAAMLKACWPDIWAELYSRYHVPGGELLEDMDKEKA